MALVGVYHWLIVSLTPVSQSLSIMQCPSCQRDNPPEASFCANCGASLATGTAAPPAPPMGEAQATAEIPSPAVAHVEASVRLSIFSAAVGFVVSGLILGSLVSWLRYVVDYDPLRAILPLAGVGGGVAVALWLSSRLQMRGRLAAALGMALIVLGSVLVVFSFGLFHTKNPQAVIGGGIVGLGLGLAFPMVFWRHLNGVSALGMGVLAVSAFLGVVVGYWAASWWGDPGPALILVILISLFIGLPSVLISPVVRLSRES